MVEIGIAEIAKGTIAGAKFATKSAQIATIDITVVAKVKFAGFQENTGETDVVDVPTVPA